MKTFFRVFNLAYPLQKNIPIYVVLSLGVIIFGLVNFTLLIPVFDLIFKTSFIPQWQTPVLDFSEVSFSSLRTYFLSLFRYSATVFGRFETLIYVSILIFVSVFISNIFRFFSQRVITKIKVNSLTFLRKKIYNTYLTQSLTFYQKRKTGNLLTIMSSDVLEVEQIIPRIFEVFLRDPFTIIFYFVTLFYLSPSLTIFTILYFPLAGLAISRIISKLRKRSFINQEIFANILSFTNETILGIKIIKAFSIHNFLKKRFDRINKSFDTNNYKMSIRRELSTPISEFLGVTMMLVVVVYGGYLVLHSQSSLSGPIFIAYIAIFSQILAPIKNIVSSISLFQKGLVAASRIFDIIDSTSDEIVIKGTVNKKNLEDAIKFESVSFAYENGKNVLKNVSFTIKKGQTIALVGKSGSGKTTIMDLLLKFYKINKGNVFVDGISINDIKINSLRQIFGIVTQEPVLFNDTIEKNIAFGVPYPEKKKIIEAAKIAFAHDFINKKEKRYKTKVGDRGIKLSGGQKQRLTIARAIYYNPPVLLLDEATSSLDTESEKMVQISLENVMKNRTSLIIAHRLSTIQKADEILVLDKGKIVEKGNHKSLMQQKGMYYDMVNMQTIK